MVLELRQGAEETKQKKQKRKCQMAVTTGIHSSQICGVEDNQKMIKATEDDEKAITVSRDTPLKRSETTSEV